MNHDIPASVAFIIIMFGFLIRPDCLISDTRLAQSVRTRSPANGLGRVSAANAPNCGPIPQGIVLALGPYIAQTREATWRFETHE